MKAFPVSFLSLILLLSGCGETETSTSQPESASGGADTSTDLGESSSTPAGTDSNESSGSDAAGSSGIAITPENTKIQFVGAHTDKTKDDRTGHFQKFSGDAVVEGGSLKSVHVEIETASLTTQIDRLTGHLKSADFFDVNQHPKAAFASTVIEDAGGGTAKITGDLTLLGTTKPITFEATVSTDGGLKLNAAFEIDRTEFGMNYGPDQVEKMVAMTVNVDA